MFEKGVISITRETSSGPYEIGLEAFMYVTFSVFFFHFFSLCDK